MVFILNIHAGVLDSESKDPQLMSALELAFTCNDEDTAFMACKTALEKHQNDKECILFIKELMVICPISIKFEKDMQLAADYVVKNSSKPLSIGIAWFRKAEQAYRTAQLNECISYCDIALKNLGYDAGICSVKGNISSKSMFEVLTLIKKKNVLKSWNNLQKFWKLKKSLWIIHFIRNTKTK